MKVKHLVSVLFVSLVVTMLAVSGVITTNKQKAALNTVKSSYSYSSTALPNDVNVYERKIDNPCAGKTCGCGNLPACKQKDPCEGKTCGCGSLPACVDPCKGKTCGCGTLPACVIINNYGSNNNKDKNVQKAKSTPTTGTLLYYRKHSVGDSGIVSIPKRYRFVVEGTDASKYTLILTDRKGNPTYYNANATKKVDYCYGKDNIPLGIGDSSSENPFNCSLLILKPNAKSSLVFPGQNFYKTCHIAKGSKIVKRLPIDQCRNKTFTLP